MPKRTVESSTAQDIYGCFRCGDTMGPMITRTDGYVKCGGCGEVSIVTLEQALDLLNNLWVEGVIAHYTDYSTEEMLEEFLYD